MVWGYNFNGNLENGKCHKLRTNVLIDISLIDEKIEMSESRKLLIVMISRVSETLIWQYFVINDHAMAINESNNRLLMVDGSCLMAQG